MFHNYLVPFHMGSDRIGPRSVVGSGSRYVSCYPNKAQKFLLLKILSLCSMSF